MKPGKRGHTLGTFGEGRGVYITNALRDAAAYQTLSPVERLILCDMIRAYNHASAGDKVSIAASGFRYTFGDCRELVDSHSFTDARRRICEHGFFRQAVELQTMKAGTPSIFLSSTEWRQFIPTGADARRLESRRKRKAATLRRNQERKAAYIQNSVKTVLTATASDTAKGRGDE